MLMCGATGLSQCRACRLTGLSLAASRQYSSLDYKLQLNLQWAGETENMKTNQKTLLTEGFI